MIVFAFVFLLVSIICILVGFSISREEKRFQANHEVGTGKLTGYYIRDNTKWDVPQVIMNINGVEMKLKCKSKRMNERLCPAGTNLRVMYIEKKTLGMKYYDARIDEERFRPYSPTAAAWGLVIFGLILMGLSIVFFNS